MADPAFLAVHHLARVLLEAGVLSEGDVLKAAERMDADARQVADDEREDAEWAAHMLRMACVSAGYDPVPPALVIGVIKGGKQR